MPLPKAPAKLAVVIKKTSGNKEKKGSRPIKSIERNKQTSNEISQIADVDELVKAAKTQEFKKTSEKIRTTKEKLKRTAKEKKSKSKKLFVLDTNVLMHDPTAIFRFQEHDIYIPLVTLEELDMHKTGLSEVSRNVRQATREIDSLIKLSVKEEGKKLTDGIPLDLLGHKDATGFLFFQTKSLLLEKNFGIGDEKPDNQILTVVQYLKKNTKKRSVVLVSKDINIRIKATALTLLAEDYFNDSVVDDDDVLYTGVKILDDSFWKINNEQLESWQQGGDTLYQINGPQTKEFHVNQFVFDEKKNMSTIVEDITRDSVVLRTLKDFSSSKNSVWGITTRNPEQNFAMNLLLDPEVDFVTLLGQAGTGKTLLALAAGLAQTLETLLYSEIIMTRATVPLGDDIGYLPGTEEEKMIPWMGALEDNLEVLNRGVENNNNWTRAAAVDLIKSRIKIKSLSFMRGRTFLSKFLIIDEAQNLTPKEMKALITRAGPGTKVICLGNVAQIDSPYLTESSSGLTFVVDKFKGWRHGAHITLRRGERSRLADFASEIL